MMTLPCQVWSVANAQMSIRVDFTGCFIACIRALSALRRCLLGTNITPMLAITLAIELAHLPPMPSAPFRKSSRCIWMWRQVMPAAQLPARPTEREMPEQRHTLLNTAANAEYCKACSHWLACGAPSLTTRFDGDEMGAR
jgi:hypothetical protein